jgi:thiamine-monophosphate kinase
MPNLQSLGEKEIIKSFISPMFSNNNVEVGVGDDSAVIQITNDISLVATIDRIPENLVAYQYGVINEEQLGQYLAVANLSDLAAMGASPLGMLMSLVMPSDFDVKKLQGLLTGINNEARKYNAPVLGGDTKGGPSRSFTIAALGTIPSGTSLTRRGARSGDKIYVTGKPGQFGVALAYTLVAKENGLKFSHSKEKKIFEPFITPRACIEQGKYLRELGIVKGCQDISDGISQTVKEIAEASGVGFTLDLDKLISLASEDAMIISRFCDCDIADILLGPGADFELIFGVSPSDAAFVEKGFSEKKWDIHCIGEFSNSGYFVVDKQGNKRVPPEGFSHFSGLSDDKKIANSYSSHGQKTK